MTNAHLLEVKQGSLNRLTVRVPRVPRLTQHTAILNIHRATQRHSSTELGLESREPWDTIIRVYVYQPQTKAYRPAR